jgi:hypothetical protein
MSNKPKNRPETTNRKLKEARADVVAAQQEAIQMRRLYDAAMMEKQQVMQEVAKRDMLLASIVASVSPETGELLISQEAVDQVEAGFFLGLDVAVIPEAGGIAVSLVYNEDVEEPEDEEEEEGDDE